MKRVQQGFTLIELMIVVAIIGILAAIAIPAFQKNIKKSKMAEASSIAQGFKTPVALCANVLGTVTGCNAGSNDIPAALGVTGNMDSLTVTNGAITVTSNAGLGAVTYILTPSIAVDGTMTWAKTGTCIAANMC